MKIDNHKHPYFNEYHPMGPALLFGLIIVTAGLYMIPWIYTKNKEFELVDKQTPDPNRGAVILLLLPFAWGYLIYIFRVLVWDHPAVEATQFFGWIFVGFLILKYLWDFSHSFARITETNGNAWFFLMLIPFAAIPAMQASLNSHFNRMHIRRKYHQLYK